MWIDWSVYRPRINQTGASAWPRGEKLGWRGSTEDHDILFFFGGSGTIKGRSDRSITVGHGTCLWLQPGHIYTATQQPDDPCQNYFVHFDLLDSNRRRRPHTAPSPPELLTNFDIRSAEASFARITTLLPYYSPDHAKRIGEERVAVAESILHGLLMDLDFAAQNRQPDESFGLRQHHSDLLMRILRDLHDHPDVPRTVQTLADDAGYSPAHFSRVFYSVMGMWPEQFLIDHRIERAKILLVKTPMSISEISDLLGYRQPSFFSTQFRSRTGCSPRAWRDSHESVPTGEK